MALETGHKALRPRGDLKRMMAQDRRFTVLSMGEDGLACRYHMRNGGNLRIIASWGNGWDHVSVSRPNKVPTYHNMKLVKRMFFAEDEWAVEYHPPASDYISINDNVLHLWRPQDVEFPKPPKEFV